MNWFKIVLIDNYANFSGRARRQEYWMFVLFWLIIAICMGLLSAFVEEYLNIEGAQIIIAIFIFATLIPWLAVNVRRLHDIGKSGGYLFINLIPIIGRIWYIVLMASSGTIGSNRYGADPKNPNTDEIEEIGKPELDA